MKKILLYQTGNIGDVVITQALGALLKRLIPGVHVTLIGQAMTETIVKASPQFDTFITPETLLAQRESDADAILFIERKQAEPVALWAQRCNIPLRVCNRTHRDTAAHCNQVLFYSNRFSGRHQALSYLQLLRGLGFPAHYSLDDIRPLFGFDLANPPVLPALDPERFNLIIHPGSNGHAREWPVEYFCELVQRLPSTRVQVYFTGSAKEAERYTHALINPCPDAINLMGHLSLQQFLHFIASADGLVANSTGPLHLSAAAGTRTLGLYVPRKGMKPSLWGPIGTHAHTLVHPRRLPCFGCSPEPFSCACMLKISISEVEAVLLSWISNV
jgi:heptosyltransferase-3